MSKCAILPTWPSHSLLYLYDSWRMSHKTCCTCYKGLWTLAVKTLGYRRRKTCVVGVKWQAWWMTPFFIFSLFLDSFVNSQEWTLSRSVPELKVVSNFFIFDHLNLDPSFAFHMWGNIDRLARRFPSTLWLIFNEMRWHGDAGWLTAGRRNEWQFWAGLVTHPGSDPTSQRSRHAENPHTLYSIYHLLINTFKTLHRWYLPVIISRVVW